MPDHHPDFNPCSTTGNENGGRKLDILRILYSAEKAMLACSCALEGAMDREADEKDAVLEWASEVLGNEARKISLIQAIA